MSVLCLAILLCALAAGQTLPVRLKSRTIDPAAAADDVRVASKRWRGEREHRLVQFPTESGAREQFERRGGVVLAAVPDEAWVVSVPSDFAWGDLVPRYDAPLAAADKWSAANTGAEFFLIAFHEDVDPVDARSLVMAAADPPLEIREHPNLLRHHLLVRGAEDQVRKLTDWDEVLYILPASDDLIAGRPVAPCEGPAIAGAHLSLIAADIGSGWAATPGGEASLTYSFGALGETLDPVRAQAEIERALNTWSAAARITFTARADANLPRHFHFLFARGDHGDPFPFRAGSGVIAHAFYPAPPNPEPWAGDVHFNEDAGLRIGADFDLFSVALHEIGHSLGLGHVDSGSAVMYPYYRRSTALSDLDVRNLLRLYASRDSAPAPRSLALALTEPAATTSAESITITAQITGGAPPYRLGWATDRHASGAATFSAGGSLAISTIPLEPGANRITWTAADSATGRATRSVTVTRTAPTATAPTLAIREPAASPTRTVSPSLRVAGVSSNATRIEWTNGSATGVAAGAASWSATIALRPGVNRIQLRAVSAEGASATQTLEVNYEPVNDTTAPTLTITSPASTNLSTSLATLAFAGTAMDSGSGVAEVTWTNSAGSKGSANLSGANWRADIALVPGFNTVTIRARDQAGNAAWRSVTVVRR